MEKTAKMWEEYKEIHVGEVKKESVGRAGRNDKGKAVQEYIVKVLVLGLPLFSN